MRTALLTTAVSIALLLPAPALGEDDHRGTAGLASTGYILGGTGDGIVARDAHALATLGVDGVAITPDGRDVAAPDDGVRHLLATAHANGLRAELLVHNVNDDLGDFDPAAAAALLRHPKRVRHLAAALAGYVESQGWDGVQIDLESMSKKDGAGLVVLAKELQARMSADKTVSLAMMASTRRSEFRARGYRLAPLAGVLDTIALMTYDQHGPGWSGPGPVGARTWQADAMDTLLTKVPAAMVDLGVAGYGYSWPTYGQGRSLTVKQARKMLARDGATAHWKRGPGEWTATLSNGTVLWWADGRSYRLRLSMASAMGLHGTALWRLGSTDPLP